MLAYGNVFDPLKMYYGEDCVGMFLRHIQDELKQLYPTFPQEPMSEITNVLKREHEIAGKYHIYF